MNYHFKLISIVFMFFFIFVNSNFFKQFEDYIASEDHRKATEVLESDLLGGSDNPKEIEIHCPQV